MMKIKIPILMLTDSLSLFAFITTASTTVEKRLIIDLEVVKKSYQQDEMEHIGLIRSETNLADCLKNANGNNSRINTLKSEIIMHPVDQWIDRSNTEDTSCQT